MNFNNKEQVIKNKNFSTADAGWTKRIDQQGHSKEAKGGSCKSGFIKGDGVCLFYTWNCYWYVGGSRGGRDFVLYKKSGLYFSSNFITPNRLPFAPPPFPPIQQFSVYIAYDKACCGLFGIQSLKNMPESNSGCIWIQLVILTTNDPSLLLWAGVIINSVR